MILEMGFGASGVKLYRTSGFTYSTSGQRSIIGSAGASARLWIETKARAKMVAKTMCASLSSLRRKLSFHATKVTVVADHSLLLD